MGDSGSGPDRAAMAWPAPAYAQVAGSIAVYPQNSAIETGSSRQFSAYVPISPNTVTWLVNDVPGGNATYGTVSPAGLDLAPAAAPAPPPSRCPHSTLY